MLRTIMKKVNKVGALCLALVLAWVFMLPGVSKATDPRDSIYELHVYKVRALTTDPVGNIDFAGTPVINFEATPNITFLTSYAQFSVFENSGESCYQASAGETVVVDPHAIYNSGGWEGTVMTGVTILAPLATAENTERIFRVEYAIVSGVSSEQSATSGATVVFVHGAPSSGVTDFIYTSKNSGLVSGNNIQNLQTATMVNGLLVPDVEITRLGDSKTWRLQYNSSVSAYIIAETNM